MSEIVPFEQASGSLALALDHYVRYPNEPLTIYVRVSGPVAPGSSLQIVLPNMIHMESMDGSEQVDQVGPALIETEDNRILQIPLTQRIAADQKKDLSIQCRIQTFFFDHYLMIESQLFDSANNMLDQEVQQVAVRHKARYLQFLPELYEGDDFINRFLMMFESFWKPISHQIDQGEYYYDPGIAPESFVPWLASWIGIPVDKNLPTHRIRALLHSAMEFYQRRGTVDALRKYLEIYTGGTVTIHERRSHNLVLGLGSRLGVETAIGLYNRPNMVAVHVCVPEGELQRMHFSQEMYNQKLRDIVRQMVPAHVFVELQSEFQESVQIEEGQRI